MIVDCGCEQSVSRLANTATSGELENENYGWTATTKTPSQVSEREGGREGGREIERERVGESESESERMTTDNTDNALSRL